MVRACLRRGGKLKSLENKFDIVFGLFAAGAVNLNDFNKPIENGATCHLPFFALALF
jgi:hypothetical protein